ncbi:TniB protein [Devosia lucknowensis]|uniref:TniB protein n=1 Tax=Devosia lucknowensis TaxID=1096929 RepID=A0A1Y6G6W1_9HYPH|nr:ATP-binding protein [Devosia lucknowensis]SMQ85902.1 TniB protein [Devosia lucknowensis]
MSDQENQGQGNEPEDVFEVIRGRMSPEHKVASEALDKLNAVYVDTARDKVLGNSFDRFLNYVTAKQRYGRRGKGNAFFVTGESGAGKTDMVERLLMEHPWLQPFKHNGRIVRPWVRVALQGPATLRFLGQEILEAIEYPIKATARQSEVWNTLPKQLKSSMVFLVHIDETQHLMTKGADTEEVSSAIKGLMNYVPFPVSFILSGKPRLNGLIVHDDQTERRNFSLALDAVHPENDRALIVKIITKHCDAVGLKHDLFVKSDMPERIAHAANHQFGRMCEVVILGIQIAVMKGDKELLPDHLAKAYRDHSNTRGLDDMNPFQAEDFETLPRGYFVTGKDEYPE